MNTQQFAQLFPLGSHLCREPMPAMSEMKRDMAILKQHGFNLIKLQEHWAIDEPAEGCYDFSRYEELIAHAAELELGIYLGLTCEQAPAWLWRKHPGCRMVGRDGRLIPYEAPTTLPGDGKPGPCFDHPGAMAEQLRFITQLVQTLGRYENIVVWNTWQEVHYWSESIVGTSTCFCEHTLAHFRRWLQQRYADIDTLNRAWNTRYAEWKDILPSRGAKVPIAVDIAWQYFMDNEQIAQILSSRAEAIRAADPLQRPVFAHKGGVTIGSAHDWAYARSMDFLGSSTYPAWHAMQAWDDANQRPYDRHTVLLTEMLDSLVLRFDYIRSANSQGKPVWAAEFQGGPVSTGFHKGRVPSADDMRRWMLAAIGSGVTAISFWVTRAEIMAAEANGFSLLDSDGDSTPRLEEVGRVGRALNEHADLFGQPTMPRAQVGILVNEWNYQLCTLMNQGGEHLPYSTRGWHRLLWEADIPVDFISTDELDEEFVRAYPVLILPFPLSLSEEVAAKLAQYVEAGGRLISDACPGRIDENGFCNRGELSPTMRELFGVRNESFTMVREPDGGQRWSPPERTWGEYQEAAIFNGVGPLEGCFLRANVYGETFVPTTSTPCLLYGHAVAGTVRQVGAGQAWLFGTFAGHNGTAYRDPETRNCIKTLLALCGITPAHQGKLLLRKRITAGKEAWIFTNPTPHKVTERIDVSGWGRVDELFCDLVERVGDTVTLTVNSLDLKVLILTRAEKTAAQHLSGARL